MAGLWAHPVGLLILGLATPIGGEHGRWLWWIAFVALIITGFRTWLQFRLLAGRLPWSPAKYYRAHVLASSGQALGWSVLSVVAMPAYGVLHWVTSLILMSIAGISAGGVTATAPSLPLLRLYTIAIWVGPLAVLTALAEEGWPILTVTILYNGFLHVQGRRAHDEYRSGVEREGALENASRVAQEASAAKDRFLANMSHEIRTPMNGILGSLALALEGRMDDELRSFLEVARDSATSLQRLLDDLLDLSKVESGHLQVERIGFDLPSLCVSVGNLWRATAEQKGVELLVEVDAGAPRYVLGDPTRLRQVLSNLLGNAAKFTQQGYVRLEVGLAAGHVTFAVHDTGVGIPIEKQAQIFDAFVQADPGTTRRFGGTGLGLAISRQLVRLMGGDILVESEVARGSCFRFNLNLPAEDALAVELAPAEVGALPSLRILLAEDALVNQRVITAMLRRLGQHVEVAGDGRQAVSAATAGRFDLVLMDVQMPEMNGLEATRAIRKSESPAQRTPIYGLSANAFAADRERGLDAGMDGYLTKPVSKRDLELLLAHLPLPLPIQR